MTNRPLLAATIRFTLSCLAASGLVLALANCGGTSGSEDETSSALEAACETVCDCVESEGGDRGTCLSNCNAIASASNGKDECESSLESYGYPSCKDTCDAFESVNSDSGPTATLADFCDKCAECMADPSFGEGFCEPFRKGYAGFDIDRCSANGDRSDLANPSLSKKSLAALSCAGFDDAE